jgi:hypothetical protein
MDGGGIMARGNRLLAFATIASAAWVVEGCSSADTPSEEGQLGSSSAALSVDAAAEAAARVTAVVPTAQVNVQNGRVTRVYGANLASGASASASANAARDALAGALGAVPADLTQQAGPVPVMIDPATQQPRFWLYRYQQGRGGVPVHGAELRTLVRNSPGNEVVWLNSTVASLGSFVAASSAFAPPADAAKANAARKVVYDAKGVPLALGALDTFSPPEQVIYAGTAAAPSAPRMAIRYIGSSSKSPERYRFIADAATGDILDSQSLTESVAVTGDIRGNATPNHVAEDCADEVSTALPYAEVAISGGTSGFSSATGGFNLPNAGTTPVTVLSPVAGRWFDLTNEAGSIETLTLGITPPNQAHFVHNSVNNQEFVRAQTNGYTAVNRARDFLLGFLPAYPTISAEENFPVTVNSTIGGLCPGNAWHFGTSILFCATDAGGSFGNSAFGTIAYHEYGHEIVESGGSGQGEYGEGMADVVAALIADDPRLGLGFFKNQCGSPLRTADNNCQFSATNCSSCGSEVHACGQLISGVVWDIREQLMASEPANFRNIISSLTLSSVLLHTGTAIDANIAIDFLSLDDNDGNLANGTPHGQQICSGFLQHGIACPIAPVPATPCAGICANPTTFTWTGSYQSGNLGTGAVCRETTHPVVGGNCGNFSGGRTLSLNGTVMPCNNTNWPSLPAARNGGYCVNTTAGQFPWAFVTLF